MLLPLNAVMTSNNRTSLAQELHNKQQDREALRLSRLAAEARAKKQRKERAREKETEADGWDMAEWWVQNETYGPTQLMKRSRQKKETRWKNGAALRLSRRRGD
ncbi:hypothetical protein AOLI_G00251680 [Acnodon oligacanthus]